MRADFTRTSNNYLLRRGRKVRMTPGQHDPLIPWATHVIQSHLQRDAMPIKGGANPYKRCANLDWGLQLDLMKPESLVIAGQLYRGEYVLKSCTRVAMRSSTLVGKSNQDNSQCLEAKYQFRCREGAEWRGKSRHKVGTPTKASEVAFLSLNASNGA